jgi:uncharacterized protein
MTGPLLLWAHGDPSSALDLSPAATVAGAALRFVQAVFEGAPYLLCGVLVSGLLRGIVGEEAVRRWFGSGRPAAVARASIVGLALPLGALGALPVARRLMAMGVPRGTAIAFLLAGAVLDPMTIILGLSMMGTGVVAVSVLTLLAWSFAAGLVLSRWMASGHGREGHLPETSPGRAKARLLRVAASLTEELSGPALREMLLVAAGAGLLGAALSPGWLQVATAPPRPAGSLAAAAVGAVAGLTPTDGVRQAGVMLRDGYTHQVSLTLLAFGSGLNLAVLAWIARTAGVRSLACLAIVGLVFWSLAGWGLDRPRHGVAASSTFHTHAFDDLGRPAIAARIGWSQFENAARAAATRAGASRLYAVALIAALATLGLVARRPRPRAALRRWESALESPPHAAPTRAWERPLSPRWAAALCLAATLPALAGLAFTYYPAPGVLFDEMAVARTEVHDAVRRGDAPEALTWIDRWEGLARKLGPGVILRRGWLGDAAGGSLDELLHRIETLRGFLEEGRIEEARTILGHVGEAQRSCRQAFESSGGSRRGGNRPETGVGSQQHVEYPRGPL